MEEEIKPQAKSTVVLVDDDQFILDMYSGKFEAEGFEVVKFISPLDALNYLRDQKPASVIITDLIIPKMDGKTFLKTIKDEKLAPQALKLVLSNEDKGQNSEDLKELINGFLVKAELTPVKVVEEVKKMINAKK